MAVLGSTSFRAWWAGTNASIPSGWTRDTDWDVDGTRGRYFQVGSSGFTTPADGGAATHTHAHNHTHTGNGHTHNITGSLVTGTSVNSVGGVDVDVPTAQHNHLAAASASATITYQTTNVTTDASGSDQPYVDWILIKPDDANQIIPVDVVCFGDSAQTPPGMYVCDGNNGTTNWADKFPRGPAAGGNGGGTGGTATHSHTSAAHVHTADSHTHSTVTLGPPNVTRIFTVDNSSADVFSRPTEHHQASINSVSVGDTSSNSFTTGTTSNEPAYLKLYALQNKSGVSLEPRPGMILGWIEAAANLPKGWEVLASAYDRQVKITTTAGDLLATGGANTHVHTQSHGHTHAATHTGTANVSYFGGTLAITSGATAVFGTGGDGHTWTVAATTPTLANNTADVASTDGRMPYRTMLLAKYIGAWDVIFTGNGVLTGNTVLQ